MFDCNYYYVLDADYHHQITLYEDIPYPSNGISVEGLAIDVDSLYSVFGMVNPVQLLIGKVYGHSMRTEQFLNFVH